MEYLIEILKHDWPLIMFMAVMGLLGFLSDFLLNRFRMKRLSRFAAQRGYKFIATDTSNAAPFFENFIPATPYRRYEVVGVANIIQGESAGVEFYYFEQQLSLPDGFYIGSVKNDSFTFSVVALDGSRAGYFEARLEQNQKLNMKQQGEWIYFWCDDRKTIPTRKMERFLAEVAGAVKVGLGKTVI